MEKNVSLLELLNLSIGSPNKSSVNFSALHTLLLEMLKLLDLQGATTRFKLSPPVELDTPRGAPVTVPTQHSVSDQLVPPGPDPQKLTGSVSDLDGPEMSQALNLIEELQKNRDDIKQKTESLQSKASEIIEDLCRNSSNLREKTEELQHKALKVIEQLHDSKAPKEKTDDMQHEGAGEQMDIKAGLEECCQRLDVLDKAVESMQELIEMYPDPEDLNQCVTWVQLVQKDMETEKEVTSEVLDQPWLGEQTEPDPSTPFSGVPVLYSTAHALSSGASMPPSGTSAPASGVPVPSPGASAPSSHPTAPSSGASAASSGTTAASNGAPAPSSDASAPSSSTTVPLPSAAALPSGSSSPSSGVSMSTSGGPLHLESSHPSADPSFPSISAGDRSLEAASDSTQASSDGSEGRTITGNQDTATEPRPVTSSVLPGSRPETLPHPGAQYGAQPAAQPGAQYAAQPAAQYGAQPAAQPAAQYVAQPAAQPAAQYGAQPAAQPGAQTAAQPAAQYGAQPAAQPGAQTAAQPAAHPGAHPAAQPGAQHGAQPAAQHGAQPAAQPGAQPAAQPAAQHGAQPAAKPGAQPAAQPGAQPAAQHGAQPAAQYGAQPAAQPATQPGAQPAAQYVAQPAAQYGAQPAAQPGAQYGAQPAAQPATQPGAQPAAQYVAQPAAQYGAQPAAQPGAQYGAQPAAQPGAQPAAQPGAQYGAQPAAQYGAQPAAQPGAQPAAQPGAQPAAQSGGQYGAQPAAQPAAQYGAQPAAQYGAQPAAQPAAQYGAQPAAQPAAQYGAQPAAQYGAQPAAQYGAQPAAQPGAQPAAQYGAQPAAQPAAQYGAQPGEHPGSHPARIRGDMKRLSDSPESRKRLSDSPESRKRFSDSPESRFTSMQMEEFLKNIRKLQERVTQLEAQTRILEEQKVDWTGLAQFISSRGSLEVPDITIDQVQQHQTVMENMKTELEKLECLEDMMRNIMSQETGSRVGDLLDSVIKELTQQVSDLRSSLDQVEKEVKILKEKQVQSGERAADQLQDQLNDLQGTLEDTIVSLTSQLSSNLQPEVDQKTEEEEEEEEVEALSESVEVGRKLSQLFENYEQLEDTVNLLVQQQRTARDGLDEDRGMGRSLDLVYDVQRAIQELQAECERLQEATRSLHEDNQQKQEYIEELYKTAEELQVKKADKLMVECEIKADKLALDSKVSRLQFDAATEQLASMFHELLNKMSGQEHDWHQLVDKLSTDMESKLNRLELDSVKLQLEERWRGILKKLQAQSAPLEDDAAGIRKKLLERFNCLSCDRIIMKQCPGPIVLTLPTFSPFPPPKSARRWTLEQIRQNYPSLTPRASQRRFQLQKTHADMLQQLDSIEYQRRLRQHPNQVAEAPAQRVRPVGAPQASKSAGRRRSSPKHHRLSTRAEDQDLMQETDIIGRDGRIYKGRFSISQLKNPETKLPNIASRDSKLKEGTKNTPEDPEAEPSPLATPPSLSTKGLNPSPPASSGSDPDWAVSPLDSGSPPSAAESQPLGL